MPTKIPYADEGWPVVTGCSHAHTGCEHCYAERLAATRLRHRKHYQGLTHNGRWTGEVRLNSDILERPLHWKKPRTIFVAQTGDLFHENVPFEFIDKVFVVMALCPRHTFLVCTKRPERMAEYFEHIKQERPGWWHGVIGYLASVLAGGEGELLPPVMENAWRTTREHYYPNTDSTKLGDTSLVCPWPLRNVRLYTSVSDQVTADENIPHLLRCPAAVRGISYEPVLGPIVLPSLGFTGPQTMVDHIIVGCESGPGRRPCELEWIESVVEQCQAASLEIYVKQIEIDGKVCRDVTLFPKHLQLRETPKGA